MINYITKHKYFKNIFNYVILGEVKIIAMPVFNRNIIIAWIVNVIYVNKDNNKNIIIEDTEKF